MPDYGLLDLIPDMARAVLESTSFRSCRSFDGDRVASEIVRKESARVLCLTLLDAGCQGRPHGMQGGLEAAQRRCLLESVLVFRTRAMEHEWVQGMILPERPGGAPAGN